MCGRYVAATDADGLVKLFVVDQRQGNSVPASYNVAPTDAVPAIVEHDGRRLLVPFRWGLVPHWARSPAVGARMINARSETVRNKPAFRDAVTHRRCLLPADGFYEWERRDGRKLPWFVSQPIGRPTAFAGLWATWRDPTDPAGPALHSCTIVTTRARGRVADLHDRMPLTVDERNWDRWLDRSLNEPTALEDLLQPSRPPEWRLRRVSTGVNSVRNNGPELLHYVADDGSADGRA